jgi:hypothetical protein
LEVALIGYLSSDDEKEALVRSARLCRLMCGKAAPFRMPLFSSIGGYASMSEA